MRAALTSVAKAPQTPIILAGVGALAALIVEVSPVVGSAALTACAVVANAALVVSFVAASKDALGDNAASANRFLLLAFGLFVACTLSLLATLNWLWVANSPTFTLRFARLESTALARAGLSVYGIAYFLVQGGFCLTTTPNSFVMEAVIIWLQLCGVAFNVVLTPIMTTRIMAITQEKKTKSVPRETFATPSLLTSLHPMLTTTLLVGFGLGSTIVFWTLSPPTGLALQLVWAAVVVVWMWELLYKRVWLSLLTTGVAQPLHDGDSVLDTVGEWLQPTVVGVVGASMLVYATTACTLLLEKTLAPEREQSTSIFGVSLHENGLAATLRLTHYAVIFVGGSNFARNEPAHLGSMLALVPATLVVMAVRVAVLSTGVAGGLGAVASASSTKASRTAASPL